MKHSLFRRAACSSMIVAASFTLACGAAEERRQPNSFEKAYTALVQDGYTSELCAKISPRALNSLFFNSPGTQIYYERSACFFYAAATELNPFTCTEVAAAGHWWHDGSFFSPESCLEYVARGVPWRATTGFDHETILRRMGYSEADLVDSRTETAAPPLTWMDLYYRLRHRDGDFQRRLAALPDFSGD